MFYDPLLAAYKGGGASAYHPKMLLKVVVYAYLSKIYASRQIAKALRQDIHFLWLSGMQRPEFSIINHFRSSRLKEVIDQVFGSMVFFLLEHGYVDLQQYFVDGTKLRADSNKHKVVWAKNTKRYEEIEHTNAREQERSRLPTISNTTPFTWNRRRSIAPIHIGKRTSPMIARPMSIAAVCPVRLVPSLVNANVVTAIVLSGLTGR